MFSSYGKIQDLDFVSAQGSINQESDHLLADLCHRAR